MKQVEMDTCSPRNSVTVYQKLDVVFEEKNTLNGYPQVWEGEACLGRRNTIS